MTPTLYITTHLAVLLLVLHAPRLSMAPCPGSSPAKKAFSIQVLMITSTRSNFRGIPDFALRKLDPQLEKQGGFPVYREGDLTCYDGAADLVVLHVNVLGFKKVARWPQVTTRHRQDSLDVHLCPVS